MLIGNVRRPDVFPLSVAAAMFGQHQAGSDGIDRETWSALASEGSKL
jgi:hypothetical protein